MTRISTGALADSSFSPGCSLSAVKMERPDTQVTRHRRRSRFPHTQQLSLRERLSRATRDRTLTIQLRDVTVTSLHQCPNLWNAVNFPSVCRFCVDCRMGCRQRTATSSTQTCSNSSVHRPHKTAFDNRRNAVINSSPQPVPRE